MQCRIALRCVGSSRKTWKEKERKIRYHLRGRNSPLLPWSVQHISTRCFYDYGASALVLSQTMSSRHTFEWRFSYTVRWLKYYKGKHCVGPSVKGSPEKVKTGNTTTAFKVGHPLHHCSSLNNTPPFNRGDLVFGRPYHFTALTARS